MTDPASVRFVYFGGEPLGAPILERLIAAGYTPALVVCNPDRPVGRKHVLTPPPVKQVATAHNLPVHQPERIDETTVATLIAESYDLFIVVAYNHLLPEALITAPRFGTLNVHPSWLPKLRGASPIRSAILNDDPAAVGVTIMHMDAQMDHGPIVTQRPYPIDPSDWPIAGRTLDTTLTVLGAELLIETLPQWLEGTIIPTPQVETAATYCHKLDRSMGELSIDPFNLPRDEAAQQALLKIRAFDGWPGTFFTYNDTRIKILDASIDASTILVIHSVIPAGKTEQPFTTYLANLTPAD